MHNKPLWIGLIVLLIFGAAAYLSVQYTPAPEAMPAVINQTPQTAPKTPVAPAPAGPKVTIDQSSLITTATTAHLTGTLSGISGDNLAFSVGKGSMIPTWLGPDTVLNVTGSAGIVTAANGHWSMTYFTSKDGKPVLEKGVYTVAIFNATNDALLTYATLVVQE